MKQIRIDSFNEVINAEANNNSVDFINVCTPAEFNEKHIPGVRNVPLDTLKDHIDELNQKATVYVHCQSGNRARQAIEQLEKMGVTADLVNVEGGLTAWEAAGFATGSHTSRLPIMRQVFIGAGFLILTGTILSYYVSYTYMVIPLFVSLGLLTAGITGWCGMSLLLAKMPWNK